MANNLRYLLEHFCLDGQKIDISSQLDEENANNIEKINTQTVPSINARIDDIKNTDIPNINSRIDNIKNTDIPSITQKINTINNTTIPNVQASVTEVNEKADRINESVTKNTRDIGTLSDNVTMQGNTINSINTEKIPSIENNVNELNTKVGTNTDSINELTSKVGTNTDSINELTTKVNTNTGNINELTTKVSANTDNINTINNTSIPHLQSEIDNLSAGGGGSVDELRTQVEKNTADITEISGKVETNTTAISTINDTSIPNLQSEIDNIKGSGAGSIGELKTKVEKNTSDISTLTRKVETNTSDISNIKQHAWEKIIDQSSNGIHVEIFKSQNMPFIEIHATLTFPQSTAGGHAITMRITDGKQYSPYHLTTAPVYLQGTYPNLTGYLFVYFENNDLIMGFKMSSYELADTGEATILYRY